MSKLKDLTGMRFGRLVVVEKAESKNGKARWICKCDCCGQRGYKLHSHHLNDWHTNKELRYDVSNGVCLCEHCHKEFHLDYMKNNKVSCTEDDYLDFKEVKQNYDIR